MKRLLTTLVILSGLIGSGGAVWADAVSDFNKGVDASDAGNKAEACASGLGALPFRTGPCYADFAA